MPPVAEQGTMVGDGRVAFQIGHRSQQDDVVPVGTCSALTIIVVRVRVWTSPPAGRFVEVLSLQSYSLYQFHFVIFIDMIRYKSSSGKPAVSTFI